jgi:hypothetical protein
MSATNANAQSEPVGADAAPNNSIELSTESSHAAKLEGRFGLGFAVPTLADDFTDTYHPGGQLHAEIGAGFGPLHLSLALAYARLHFNTSQTSNQNAPDDLEADIVSASIEGGSLNLAAAMVQGRWDLSDHWLRPYLVAGGGMVLSVPEEARVRLTLADDMGDTSTTTLSNDPDNTVDPMFLFGIGATDVSGPFDIFGQLHASIMLGDEVIPMAMVSVGVGI